MLIDKVLTVLARVDSFRKTSPIYGSSLMTYVTAAQLESYLNSYGWKFEATGENGWKTGFQGNSRLYPLSIKLCDTYVSFEIRPLIDIKVDCLTMPGLARYLLEMNNRLKFVKLGVSKYGVIVLSAQAMVSGFDYETFARMIGVLGYYADEVAPQIYDRITTGSDARRPAFLS